MRAFLTAVAIVAIVAIVARDCSSDRRKDKPGHFPSNAEKVAQNPNSGLTRRGVGNMG